MKKTNARSESSRSLALGANLTTLIVVGVGLLMVLGIYFGYTKGVRASDAQTKKELSQAEIVATQLSGELSRWRSQDPELLALVAQVRSAEAAIPKSPANGSDTKVAFGSLISAAEGTSGVKVNAVQEDPNVFELSSPTLTGLSYVVVAVEVNGTSEAIEVFTTAMSADPNTFITTTAGSYTHNPDGSWTAKLRFYNWFTPVPDLVPAPN